MYYKQAWKYIHMHLKGVYYWYITIYISKHKTDLIIAVVVIVWWLDLQLLVQSVLITSKVVSWNPDLLARRIRYTIMW